MDQISKDIMQNSVMTHHCWCRRWPANFTVQKSKWRSWRRKKNAITSSSSSPSYRVRGRLLGQKLLKCRLCL